MAPNLDSIDLIASSHARSLAFGLREHESADIRPASSRELAHLVERNQHLCQHARPVMETLYQQILGTCSMVMLTDSEGTILHALGDDDFLASANRVALRPGVEWSERSKGTNAIGTALTLGAPVQVHADEHFLRANHFLTCSCAPIVDPAGHIIGALDVSGDHRSQSKHTMALVRMSAQMVENHLFNKRYEAALRLHFHARPEFIGTLMEGMVAFDSEGNFLAANRSGLFQLGLSLPALQGHDARSLFGLDLATLVANSRQSVPGLLTLRLPEGVTVYGQAEFTAPPAVATRATEKPRAPVLSGLHYLDTGDPQLARVISRVRKAQQHGIATLILGETGTGKELLAQAMHHDSRRSAGPFVAVNCAAIPESLIESELFGYAEGAFTGARRRGNIGRIQQAHGGTLFLDEIGDMPLAMQARLLRVLQERQISPLGSQQNIPVDVALICATHRDLPAMIAAGGFREDLYYRINGLSVRLPPLRERSDIDIIVNRLLRAEAQGGRVMALSAEVKALFARYDWPGNFRQLANVLRLATLLADDDGEIRPEHLPDDFLDALRRQPATPKEIAGGAPLQTLTAQAIDQALAQCGGNVSAAARRLGVSRNTIYRHLQRQHH